MSQAPPHAIAPECLDQILVKARTVIGFLPTPVSIELLQKVYELASFGPTSMNTQPTRYVFLQTPEARARLLPAMSPGNLEKTRSAPATVIVATDMRFYVHMDEIWHKPGAGAMFSGNAALTQATAVRNGTLGSAYFMIAARALGLDCGPMSGVDLAKVDAEFFPDGRFKANYIINLGHGDDSLLFKRNPRLSFKQACSVL